jgi:hypothetical protein
MVRNSWLSALTNGVIGQPKPRFGTAPIIYFLGRYFYKTKFRLIIKLSRNDISLLLSGGYRAVSIGFESDCNLIIKHNYAQLQLRNILGTAKTCVLGCLPGIFKLKPILFSWFQGKGYDFKMCPIVFFCDIFFTFRVIFQYIILHKTAKV